MSAEVFLTILGLFAPLIIAAIVAYTFDKYNQAKTVIIAFIADVVIIAAYASWTVGNWSIYEEPSGGLIWLPIAILWIVGSLVVFIVISYLVPDEMAETTEDTTKPTD